ncbi:MAG: Dabb family protein [Puniceicoccaceae bacterium]|nr:MAG: Dabb family protein [Puniceicoccaceae bacterium]
MPVEHLVFFRLKAGTPAAATTAVIEAFKALHGVIPGLLEVSMGPNITIETQFAKGNDLGLRMRFDTAENLRAYLDHPAHVKAAEHLIPEVEDITVFDLEA